MTAYYNEFDPYAAAWLRNLITAGHIADGVVDTRSIEDVRPSDLTDFTQCHFFAGVGVWSHALRAAGWSDDRPVWTGSCPCQPFSAAGKGTAFDDKRHLWPHFHHLIKERRPAIVLGEQVASKDADPWIDLVHADMETMGYAFGAVPFPSASVGAPHIRDRLYWAGVGQADASSKRLAQRKRVTGVPGRAPGPGARETIIGSGVRSSVGLADSNGIGSHGKYWGPGEREPTCASGSAAHGAAGRVAHADGRDASTEREQCSREQRQQPQDGGSVRLADTIVQQRPDGKPRIGDGDAAPGWQQGAAAIAGLRDDLRPRPTNGYWADVDWLGCKDGKWRPVEPGTFPLAHGATSRMGRLRAYGNAINAEAARIWIEIVMEYLP